MKALVLIFLCLNIIACGDRSVENPAAEAPLYFEEEFEADSKALLSGMNVYNSGLLFRLDTTRNSEGEVNYEVVIVKFPGSQESREKIEKALSAEAERIDEFLKKYNGMFRIRYKDGDLKALALKDETKAKMRNLKKAWLKALKNLETL